MNLKQGLNREGGLKEGGRLKRALTVLENRIKSKLKQPQGA